MFSKVLEQICSKVIFFNRQQWKLKLLDFMLKWIDIFFSSFVDKYNYFILKSNNTHLLLALQTYSPLSWLWVYATSNTTKPKSDTDLILVECRRGWPLWNHSTFILGSPTGIRVHSKWAESPSFSPSTLCGHNAKC